MANSADKPIAPLHSLSDFDLVDRARLRDGAAFELIIRRHNQVLFRAARGVLDNKDQAQDVVQEAYLKAFTHLDSFQEKASLKTWLTRIVVNQAIDFKRRHRPASPTNENVLFMHNHPFADEDMARNMTDPTTPETETSRQEMKNLLDEATRRLPEIYRCVFVLRDVEGLSTADTAFCLNVNETLVKKRLSRAREMLREDLLKKMVSNVSEIFEFAGKQCDLVTENVMTALAQRGMVADG